MGLYSAQLEINCIPQTFRYSFSGIGGCSWRDLNLKLELYAYLVVIYFFIWHLEVAIWAAQALPIIWSHTDPFSFLGVLPWNYALSYKWTSWIAHINSFHIFCITLRGEGGGGGRILLLFNCGVLKFDLLLSPNLLIKIVFFCWTPMWSHWSLLQPNELLGFITIWILIPWSVWSLNWHTQH